MISPIPIANVLPVIVLLKYIIQWVVDSPCGQLFVTFLKKALFLKGYPRTREK